MSSFSCPHLNIENGYCIMLNVDCVPGRKGCVISSRKFKFAFPPENRLKNETQKLTKNNRLSDNR